VAGRWTACVDQRAPLSDARIASDRPHVLSNHSVSACCAASGLFSGSSDKTIKAVESTGQVVVLCDDAHPAPVNVLRSFADFMLVSGDDDGGLRIWDSRVASREPAALLTPHEDVVTDLLVDVTRHTLLSTSGDGTLGIHDLRKPGKKATMTEQASVHTPPFPFTTGAVRPPCPLSPPHRFCSATTSSCLLRCSRAAARL
jgi:WD40 repeat protein